MPYPSAPHVPAGHVPAPHVPARRRTRSLRRLTGPALLLALAGTALATAPAPAADAPPSPAHASISWRADLTHPDGDDLNVRHTANALRVRDASFRPASQDRGRGLASAVLAPRHVDHPVDRVGVDVDATVPAGASVVIDVRGRDTAGTWTEWYRASAGAPARLPRGVGDVQARLTLEHPEGGATAVVRSLTLTADDAGTAARSPRAATAAFSARVYATREGLVGGTTANGHVIKPDDHFVALPSRRALSPKGSGQYSVQVCGPARCETAPVWDVGPWNTHDDHWNPSAQREQWKDLARGLPEAQAAYQNGYHGGLDEFGRRVANPAGIDLADGTFYNVGLNNNGWVTVTYLWTDGGAGKSFPTWGTDVSVRKQATTASTRVASLPGPTTVRVTCQVHGQSVTYGGRTNDAWAYLPDYGGYVSNLFVDVPEAWLPGVPTC